VRLLLDKIFVSIYRLILQNYVIPWPYGKFCSTVGLTVDPIFGNVVLKKEGDQLGRSCEEWNTIQR